MTKTRISIPKATVDAVMKPFNHLCARCGTPRPQIHHIDENPSNNDPLNLIPLCPNCHLIDLHDPTRPIDPEILKLFRVYRDPTILKPQFQPLFNRVRFVDEMEAAPESEALRGSIQELVDFVAALEMGSFYAKQIEKLIHMPAQGYAFAPDDPSSLQRVRRAQNEHAQEHRAKLRQVRDRVYDLVVELLRFQKW